MFKPLAAFATGTLLLSSPGLLADEPAAAPEAPGLFAQLDTNKDGLLADDEIPADRKSLFGRLIRLGDKNTDGKLSADEFAVAMKGGDQPSEEKPAAKPDRPSSDERGPGRLFARLDANSDGKITLDEVPAEGRERFEKLIQRADQDGDKALTPREFLQGMPRPEGGKGPGAKGQGAKGKGPAGRPARDLDPAQLFKRMDANGDGKVTADEAPEQRRPMVERMLKRGDQNGDGSLSVEELGAVLAQRRPAGQDSKNPEAKKPDGEKPAEADKPTAATENAPAEATSAVKVDPSANAKPGKPAKAGKKEAKQAQAAKLVVFIAVDADRDGKLSTAEISQASDSIRKLDKDGDGTVSPRELQGNLKKKKDKKPKK